MKRKQCCKCKIKKVYFQSIFITQGWFFFLKSCFLSIYLLFFCRRNRRAVCANNSPHLGIENRVMNMVSYRILSKCLLLNLINWESAYVWNRIHYFFKQTIYNREGANWIFLINWALKSYVWKIKFLFLMKLCVIFKRNTINVHMQHKKRCLINASFSSFDIFSIVWISMKKWFKKKPHLFHAMMLTDA